MAGKIWTKKEDRILKKYFPHEKTEITAGRIGRTYKAVALHAREMGIKKTDAYMTELLAELSAGLAKSGNAHQFKKGQEPINKGVKQNEWMTADGMERIKATQFKKGQRPKTAPPVGTVLIRSEDSKQYKYVGRVPLQRIEWEKVNGPIPKGSILVCKSKDTLNEHPSNWEVITRSENMQRNSYHNYGPEIAKTFQALGVLTRQINKTKRNGKENN